MTPNLAETGWLTESTVNPKVLVAEYAVRGPVVAHAQDLQEKLNHGESALPFSKIISCNIGNPQSLGQKPITFFRQVIALCACPSLIDSSALPEDVKLRAREYLAAAGSSIGAYTETEGLALIRKQIAEFISARDGYPSDPKRIMLTAGATDGIKRAIQVLIRSCSDGILIPCPQYPLYSCQITLCGGQIVYYPLEEDRNWAVSGSALAAAWEAACAQGVTVRAITVINPGNPTGAVLSYEDIAGIIRFSAERKVVILADEVYQENVYTPGKVFVSFKKILCDLKAKEPELFDAVQLFSFHSTSKGLIGECGLRGGYMELVGFDAGAYAQVKKVGAASLSSNTIGQITCGLMVKPPRVGDPSYPVYMQEITGIFESLKRRAEKVYASLNKVPGYSCQRIEGSMYAFPRFNIPERAVAYAKELGTQPADEMYCIELLEATGIVCVPGSGFGQAEGTFHMRLTILPPEKDIDFVVDKIASFHAEFCKRWN